jgi:ribonuclease VapC
MSKTYVLDASAVICILGNESGASEIENLKSAAVISSVNYAEVVSKLKERGGSDHTIDEAMASMTLTVIDFNLVQAVRCGRFRAATKVAGLSLGDRACLALAAERKAVAVTTDKTWLTVDVGVEVKVVR